MNSIVVAYHTRDAYAKEAERLRASLEKHKIQHAIRDMDPFPSWAEAVAWKPRFVQNCFENFRECDGILYVDADAEFVSAPDWSVVDGAHLAFHRFHRRAREEAEFLTGTMWFANTPTVADFVAEWAKETRNYLYTDTPEQHGLKRALTASWLERMTVTSLPATWVWITDDFPKIYGNLDPVILQHQASRRLKHSKKR